MPRRGRRVLTVTTSPPVTSPLSRQGPREPPPCPRSGQSAPRTDHCGAQSEKRFDQDARASGPTMDGDRVSVPQSPAVSPPTRNFRVQHSPSTKPGPLAMSMALLLPPAILALSTMAGPVRVTQPLAMRTRLQMAMSELPTPDDWAVQRLKDGGARVASKSLRFRPPLYPSIHLSIHPSIYLSICLSFSA